MIFSNFTPHKNQMPDWRGPRINRDDAYGKKCFFAIIRNPNVLPAADNTTEANTYSTGDSGMRWRGRKISSGSSDTVMQGDKWKFSNGIQKYGENTTGNAPAEAPVFDTGLAELRYDLHFQNKKSWTVLGIFHISNIAGTDNIGDPRIFSCDDGANETDHTFMFGLVKNGPGFRARMRIGFGGGRTAGGDTTVVTARRWSAEDHGMVAVTYDGAVCTLYAVFDDGDIQSATLAKTTDVSVATDTDDTTRIGATASGAVNPFKGAIHLVAGFNMVMNPTQLLDYFKGPYRIYEPVHPLFAMRTPDAAVFAGQWDNPIFRVKNRGYGHLREAR